ncbi:MAG: hypothetical protein ACK4U0_02910 [Mesorhizobium sp.]
MRTERYLVLAAILALPATAMAQEFPAGVYAASPELCEVARTGGAQAIFEDGYTVLTANGFLGIEYHCDFLQVLPGKRTPGFVVTALCEEPGYAFPDVLAIVPRGEGELQVTSTLDAAGGEPSGNSGTYHLCEGLTLP